MTLIAVIDFETTGLNPEVDKVIEAASVMVDSISRSIVAETQWRFDPGIPIPPEASAVHHLTAEDLIGRPAFCEPQWFHNITPKADVIAAHNAKFDLSFVPWEKRPHICTYKCAVHFFPHLPNHTNQTCRYALGLKPVLPTGLAPHSALYDAITTASLLIRLLEMHTPEMLINISSKPLLLPKVTFGKHAGLAWKDVPRDYIDWILRQDFDEDVVYTAKYWRR